MKKCSKCSKEKPATEFFKDKRTKSGLYSACKICHQMGNKSSFSMIGIEPTPKIVALTHYRGILFRLARGKTYKKRTCTFSLDELEEWFVKNWEQYVRMYDKWKASGFEYRLSPSIDRLDDEQGYHLHNIRLLTRSENASKPRPLEQRLATSRTLKARYLKNK